VHHPITLSVGTLQETINVAGPGVPNGLRMSAPRPAPAPCTPTETGGRIVPPLKVRDVRPAYPAGGVTAPVVVTLEARIGFDGTVAGIRATSAAPAELVRAASDAVTQWEFTPTLLNCEPVEVLMNVTITFTPPGVL
jgi:periplasmic protein TonB